MAQCIKPRKASSGTPKVTINVYGGAYETIEIGDYTTITDANGLGTMEVKASDMGKSFTPTCSVSGWNTSVTLNTNVYCMPSGALYWYGNEMTSVTGGWDKCYESNGANGTLQKNTNSMYVASPVNSGGSTTGVTTINSVGQLFSNYQKLYLNIQWDKSGDGLWVCGTTGVGLTSFNYYKALTSANDGVADVSGYLANYNSSYPNLDIHVVRQGKFTLRSVWLE